MTRLKMLMKNMIIETEPRQFFLKYFTRYSQLEGSSKSCFYLVWVQIHLGILQ